MDASDTGTNADDATDGFAVRLPGRFEGPLDLLLDLVRSRKLDVHALSLVAVTGPFLDYVRGGGVRRLDDTAQWLSVAATLVWIKSRIFVENRKERSRAREVADDLAVRLRRLEIVRDTARRLTGGAVLGRDVFGPGGTDARASTKAARKDLSTVLRLYAAEVRRSGETAAPARVDVIETLTVERAIEILTEATGDPGWRSLAVASDALPPVGPRIARVAATYVAALELARTGGMEIRQAGATVELRPLAPDGGAEAAP